MEMKCFASFIESQYKGEDIEKRTTEAYYELGKYLFEHLFQFENEPFLIIAKKDKHPGAFHGEIKHTFTARVIEPTKRAGPDGMVEYVWGGNTPMEQLDWEQAVRKAMEKYPAEDLLKEYPPVDNTDILTFDSMKAAREHIIEKYKEAERALLNDFKEMLEGPMGSITEQSIRQKLEQFAENIKRSEKPKGGKPDAEV